MTLSSFRLSLHKRKYVLNSCSVSWLQPRNGSYTVGDFMTRKEDLHVVKATTTVDEGMFEHHVCVGCHFVNYMLIYGYLLPNHYSSRVACGEENNRLPCDWWWLEFGNFQYLFTLISRIKDLFPKQSQIEWFTQFSL